MQLEGKYMKVTLKYGNIIKEFNEQPAIIIGNSAVCDFVVSEFSESEILKLVYSPQYNGYVLMNVSQSRDILCNGKVFSKILAQSKFSISSSKLPVAIEILLEETAVKTPASVSASSLRATPSVKNNNSSADNDIEKQRVGIIKEIGYKILELKNNIKSASMTGMLLNGAMGILSVVSSFGITNFLLGFKVDNSSSVLNLTTNFWFLGGITLIVLAICLILRWGIFSLLDFNANKKYGETAFVPKFIIGTASVFLFIVYVMNLFYYKSIPGFAVASAFVSLLFVGALATVAIGSGYFKFQSAKYQQELTNYEFREDFEAVMKDYRKMITQTINKLSPNKINTVKSNLVNNQMKMFLEGFVGLLTAPFLAYGVSNTLASCFPEAANWVRISGLRFSPIFLVLATFLIIFAFFSFVRAFTAGKQIKGSEIIKFDGFHDYNSHGVTVLGLDSMRSLEKEKKLVMFIACFIILIEFTMNVSYFITEIGGDIQGMFLSIVTALVPTALLIAETHMLSETMYKINNYNELLATLD